MDFEDFDFTSTKTIDARYATSTTYQELANASVLDKDIIKAEILPTLNPFFQDQFFKAEAIAVPPGYGFGFEKTFNNGWTDNNDVGQRPLEGFDFPNETEFYKPARRAALIGCDPYRENESIYIYTPEVDNSRVGGYFWPNRSDKTWKIWWFMNDRYNGYLDNRGTANVDFAIWRLT